MANSFYDQLPETPCMFKPIGVKKFQDTIKLLRKEELLKLVSGEDGIYVCNLAHQKIGYVPPYLEALMKPYIDAAPDGFFYAKVKSVSGKLTMGVWCVLLESPSLPDFLTSSKTEMSLWYGKVAGVSFEDRQKWWEKIEADTALDGSYPHVLVQKEDMNPADSNALRVLAYFSAEGWQHIGYVCREDAKEIRFASLAGMRFFARLISVGRNNLGIIGGTIEIAGMVGASDGFEVLA